MTVLLRLDRCGLLRGDARRPIFRDVSFEFRVGRRYAISGPSGSGKTTLALVIAGLLKPSTGSVVRFEAFQKRTAPVRMVFQDPFAGMDPLWKVRDWLDDVGQASNRADRLDELCKAVELTPQLLDRYPLELSGGECQRFNVVCALLGDPLLLILDEATSMVDATTRQMIRSIVESHCANSSITVINIEHGDVDTASEALSIRLETDR
jgi:peptide/nickel transport system ATP-binding protein